MFMNNLNKGEKIRINRNNQQRYSNLKLIKLFEQTGITRRISSANLELSDIWNHGGTYCIKSMADIVTFFLGRVLQSILWLERIYGKAEKAEKSAY